MPPFIPISGITKSQTAVAEAKSAAVPSPALLKRVAAQFDAILAEIEEGSAVTKTLRKRKLKGGEFYAYLNATDADPAIPQAAKPSLRYVRARETRRELRFEEITEIANKARPEDAHVARLKVDVVKWQLSKEDPSKYGDKPLTINAGPTTNILVVGDAALEELQKARRELLESAGRPALEA